MYLTVTSFLLWAAAPSFFSSLWTGPELQAAPGQQRYEVGHLRHLHWLAPKDGVLRFATAAQIVAGADLPAALLNAPAASLVQVRNIDGVLEVQVAVPFDLLLGDSWIHAANWRVVQLRESLALACVDRVTSTFHLIGLSTGEPLIGSRKATRLLDVRQCGLEAECLLATGADLVILRIRGDGSDVSVTKLHTSLDRLLNASFVAAFPIGSSTREDVWAVGWRSGKLAIVEAGTQKRLPIELNLAALPEKLDPIRFDAAGHTGRTWLALGNPRYRHGVGRIAVVEVLGEKVRILWDGRPDAEIDSDTLDQRNYGQCVAFVPDADNDGVPDLVVTGPWALMDTRVDLLSVASVRRLKQNSKMLQNSTGHSLDVSSDGRLLLVGGAAWRGYPERMSHAGIARILSAADLAEDSRIVLDPAKIEVSPIGSAK